MIYAMMFPPDPLRQKMLFKTEWKTLGATGFDADLLAKSMNVAFTQLAREGYNVHQILPAPSGMLVVGQRLSSPAPDPTPQGVPVPGTSAQQSVEVVYAFATEGRLEQETVASLQDAVKVAARDLEESAQGGKRQPISIHVVSTTVYSAGDLHVLRDRMT